MTRTRFRILFVCTGNICRSPFAELVTRNLLAKRLRPEDVARFSVASAGTRAVAGAAMNVVTRAELRRWGLHGAAGAVHVARQLDRDAVASADLVLTAERSHRADVVSLHPSALHVTFCLREFSRLLAPVTLGPAEHDPVRRARAAVSTAALQRGAAPPVSEADDVVPDPIGQSLGVHHRSAFMIATEMRRAIGVILGD